MRCLPHLLQQVWISEAIFLWSPTAVIVNDCINKSLAQRENLGGVFFHYQLLTHPFLLLFTYVIMDDLYGCIDVAVDASTENLWEDPIAKYLGYDWCQRTPDAFV